MDINLELLENWKKSAEGIGDKRVSCNLYGDMLSGILSLENNPETAPLYQELQSKGFDAEKMVEMIGRECEVVASEPIQEVDYGEET